MNHTAKLTAAHIEIEPQVLDPSATATKKRKHHLSAADKLFAEIRDLNFAVVGTRLSKLARRLEGDYGGAKNLKSVSQMKDFVGKLGGLQSEQQALRLREYERLAVLTLDTTLAERLMPITRTDEFNKNLEAQQNLVAGYNTGGQLTLIEDLVCQQADPWPVLRAAVLLSMTNGGLKQKQLETFKRDFLQTYGYHHLPLLVHLQDLGLLLKSPAPTPFVSARKPLKLITSDEVDDAHPTDISFTYSGYAPLSIRLVQAAAQRSAISGDARADVVRMEGKRPITGFKGMEETVAAVPGATSDTGAGRKTSSGITLVFFLGGCTYAEVSALRWMSRQGGRKFIVATTGFVNGTSVSNHTKHF